MKINENTPLTTPDVGRTQPLARRTVERAPETVGSERPAATVELSSRSRELHEALRAANGAPEIREDVVSDVRRRLADGTYRIDDEVVARALLDRRA